MNFEELKELIDNIEDKKSQFDRSNFFKLTFHQTFTADLIDVIGKDKIENWLHQFKSPEDKDIASEIFSKIQYYDSQLVKDLCKLAFIEWQINNQASIQDAIFIPLGLAGKSGQMVGYLFRTVNGIPEFRVKYQESLSKEDIIQNKHIIFLDDFTGTGNQFLKNPIVKDTIKLKEKEQSPIQLAFISLVATEEAIENIQNNINIQIISPHIRRKAYASNDDEFIQFNERYGSGLFKRGDKDQYLGWGDIGETIVFFYNIPNNTLPILWSGAYSKATQSNWMPLFTRSGVNGARPAARGENAAKAFYEHLTNSTLYSEDYLIWTDLVKEIYLKMRVDTFELNELHTLLSITSNLMIPYDMLTYDSPLPFLNKIRIYILDVVAQQTNIKCSEENFTTLLNILDVDQYSVTQGFLLRNKISSIIKNVILKNNQLLDLAINNLEINKENIYIVQGFTSALLMISNEEFRALLLPLCTKLKAIRYHSTSHTLRFHTEVLLAKLEARKINLQNINLDIAKRHVNYYGEYKILSVNIIKSHLGQIL
ncbi:hypothetical protein ACO11K_003420 [Bacillus cytotoxicus]